MSAPRRGPMPIEERAKRYLASCAQHGGPSRAKAYREVGEAEQCQIAGRIIGAVISPDNQGNYYVQCPGKTFHTGKPGRRDCRFMPGGRGEAGNGVSAPSLHCVHKSCGTVIEEMNKRIRSEVGKASVEYLTDHGTQLENAAAALIIGFDMDAVAANKILCEWGKTCTPAHTANECGKAIAAAQAASDNTPDEVGYLLQSPAKAPQGTANPPTPTSIDQASVVPAHDLGEAFTHRDLGPDVEPGAYIGARARIVEAAERQIANFKADYGDAPTSVLLGPDQPRISGNIKGIPIERMQTLGISVHGGTVGT